MNFTHEQWNDILWRADEFRICFWFIGLYFFFGPSLKIKFEKKEKDDNRQ